MRRNVDRDFDEDNPFAVMTDGPHKRHLELWAYCAWKGVQEFKAAICEGRPPGHIAIRWVTEDEHHPGSFAWTCDLFGWSTEQARNKLLVWARAKVDELEKTKARNAAIEEIERDQWKSKRKKT